jgi:hypothetical protein
VTIALRSKTIMSAPKPSRPLRILHVRSKSIELCPGTIVLPPESSCPLKILYARSKTIELCSESIELWPMHHHSIPTPLRLLDGLTHHGVWLVPLWGTPLESRQASSFYIYLFLIIIRFLRAHSLKNKKKQRKKKKKREGGPLVGNGVG